MVLRWLLRDVRNNPMFFLLFTLSLSVGLVGFLTLDIFKRSINHSIQNKSKELLTADISISGRRNLTAQELQFVDGLVPGLRRLEVKDVYTMAALGEQSRLVQLRVVPKGFPFYGSMQLQQAGMVEAKDMSPLHDQKVVWVYPELGKQLGAEIGRSLRLGDAEFVVGDVVSKDAGQAAGSFAELAPRVYMSDQFISDTQLVASKGSTLYYSHLLRIPEGVDIKEVVQKLSLELSDPALRVFDHSSAGQQTARFISYLNDYLGLVAIVALFMAALGSAYLLRGFLLSRLKEVAILRSLGMTPAKVTQLFLFELLVFSWCAAGLAIALSYVLLPLFREMVRQFTPFSIELQFSFMGVAVALFVSSALVLIIGWPLLSRLKKVQPSVVFQENVEQELRWSLRDLAKYLPGLVFFWGLSVWLSASFKVGSLFVAGFFVSSAVLAIGCWFLLYLLDNIISGRFGKVSRKASSRLWLKLGLLHLSRKKLPALTTFSAIALGVLLVNLLAQLEVGLRAELSPEEGGRLPNLFLIDVQDEQLSPLQELLAQSDFELDLVSPMIRGRLMAVNAEDFEKQDAGAKYATREGEREAQFRNRGFNLSYRRGLAFSEELVEGLPIDSNFNADAEEYPFISVEYNFAKRFSWAIGDVLTFDIQGVPVEAKIRNFRKVRWASFQPNFFIQFQPGVLEEAPKTFIAIMSGLDRDRVLEAQQLIVSKFANISLVDVDRTVERILGVVDQISWALRFMAYLVLLAGAFVLFAIGVSQANDRRSEATLLKSLGLPFEQLRKALRSEFLLIAVSASLFGVVLSFCLSFLMAHYLFDRIWLPEWGVPVLSIVFVSVFSLYVSRLAMSSGAEDSLW